MARNIVIGIVVAGKNTAGGALKATGSMLGGLASKGAKAFAGFGKAMVMFNQTLEVGMKAYRLFDLAIGRTVRKALEFRSKNDEAAVSLRGFSKDISLVQARLGDAMLPAVLAVTNSIRPLLQGMQKWLVANRDLIASKFVDWLMGIANFMGRTLPPVILFIGRAWMGWQLILNGVGMAVKAFGFLVARAFGGIIGASATVAEALGFEEKAASLRGFKKSIDEFGDGMEVAMMKGADEQDAILERLSAMEEFAGNKLPAALQSGIGKLGVQAQKELGKATTGTNESLEEQKKRTEDVKKAQLLLLENEKFRGEALKASASATKILEPQVLSYKQLQVASKAAALELHTVRARMIELGSAANVDEEALAKNRLELENLKDRAADLEQSIEKANAASVARLAKLKEMYQSAAGEISNALLGFGEAFVTNQKKQVKVMVDGEEQMVTRSLSTSEKIEAARKGLFQNLLKMSAEFFLQEAIQKIGAAIFGESGTTAAAASGASARTGIRTAEAGAATAATAVPLAAALTAEKVHTARTVAGASLRIQAHAAEGAAKAAAANAWTIAGAAIAGAVVLAMILAFMGKLPKFHDGGIVPGAPGREVIAKLETGEAVLSRDTTEELRRNLGVSGGRASLASAPAAMGRPVSVSVTSQTLGLPDRAQSRRWIRDVVLPELVELGVPVGRGRR